MRMEVDLGEGLSLGLDKETVNKRSLGENLGFRRISRLILLIFDFG